MPTKTLTLLIGLAGGVGIAWAVHAAGVFGEEHSSRPRGGVLPAGLATKIGKRPSTLVSTTTIVKSLSMIATNVSAETEMTTTTTRNIHVTPWPSLNRAGLDADPSRVILALTTANDADSIVIIRRVALAWHAMKGLVSMTDGRNAVPIRIDMGGHAKLDAIAMSVAWR